MSEIYPFLFTEPSWLLLVSTKGPPSYYTLYILSYKFWKMIMIADYQDFIYAGIRLHLAWLIHDFVVAKKFHSRAQYGYEERQMGPHQKV